MPLQCRSLPDAAVFALLASALAVQAVRLGGYAWLLLWPAVGFAAIAVACAGVGVRLFGKRPTGGFGRVPALLNAPARSTLEAVWWLRLLASRQAPFHEITPTLFLGRRPIRSLPAVEVIVDLAGELAASRLARRCAGYRSVPVLDRSTGGGRRLRLARPGDRPRSAPDAGPLRPRPRPLGAGRGGRLDRTRRCDRRGRRRPPAHAIAPGRPTFAAAARTARTKHGTTSERLRID